MVILFLFQCCLELKNEDMIEIKKFVFNPIQENTMVLYDETGEALIVDAGCSNPIECSKLDDFIRVEQLKPVLLINTHCHFDHLMGAEYVRSKYKIEFAAHSADYVLLERASEQGKDFGISTEAVRLPERGLEDGQVIHFGQSELEVLHVPGHSPGSVAFFSKSQKFVIVGDLIFYKSIGRTDLPLGDYDTIIDSIFTKILSLGDDVRILPGHGPETNVAFEKENNPFLRP